MQRGWKLAVLLIVAVGIVGAVGSAWWLGRQHALHGLAFADVSARTAADAMQGDHFFSDYGDKILVVHGSVTSVRTTGSGYAVSIGTGASFGVTCTVAAPAGAVPPAAASAITVVAPGGTAQREPSSVDLPDCRVMTTH